MKQNIYFYTSYKQFLLDFIKERALRGTIGQIAAAAGCDRTYFSQVLHGNAHLLPDHVPGLAQILELKEVEENYLLFLILFERAGSEASRRYYRAKMRELSEQHASLSAKAKQTSQLVVDQDKYARYFGDLNYQMVHLLTSIAGGQSLKALCRAIRMAEPDVQAILDYLIHLELVMKTGEYYRHSGQSLHVVREGAWNKINHLNWRMKAVEKSNATNGIHFSSLFSIASDDYEKMIKMVHDFLEKYQKVARDSKSEEVVAFCCDFFRPLS